MLTLFLFRLICHFLCKTINPNPNPKTLTLLTPTRLSLSAIHLSLSRIMTGGNDTGMNGGDTLMIFQNNVAMTIVAKGQCISAVQCSGGGSPL